TKTSSRGAPIKSEIAKKSLEKSKPVRKSRVQSSSESESESESESSSDSSSSSSEEEPPKKSKKKSGSTKKVTKKKAKKIVEVAISDDDEPEDTHLVKISEQLAKIANKPDLADMIERLIISNHNIVNALEKIAVSIATIADKGGIRERENVVEYLGVNTDTALIQYDTLKDLIDHDEDE
ncbi:hypothetical protein BGZ82_002246, partial [Podila clonocystis]